jgi:heptosyltransferase-2/heptosyltransferase-3
MAALRAALRLRFLQLVGTVLRRRVRPSAPAQPLRVLLVRPDHIGDVLLASPAVALLGASLPGAEFTYLVGPWSVDLARHGPLGDTVRTLEFPGFTRRPKGSLLQPYVLLWRAARQLRARRHDAAVIFRPDHWWGALLALAAGIPVRLGHDRPEPRPLLSHAISVPQGLHAAEQALALARAAVAALGGTPRESVDGRPLFRVLPEEEAAAERFFVQHGLGARPVVALQPSAGAPLKSWPPERWAAVADGLTRGGADVLLSGGPEDGPLLAEVRAHMAAPPAAVLCAQPLGMVGAVLRRCALVCGPDGGVLHLAAALGVPTVRLYGPAPPQVFGPWPPRTDQRVLITGSLACVPCGRLVDPPCGAGRLPACMLALTVEEVLGAAREVLCTAAGPAMSAGH